MTLCIFFFFGSIFRDDWRGLNRSEEDFRGADTICVCLFLLFPLSFLHIQQQLLLRLTQASLWHIVRVESSRQKVSSTNVAARKSKSYSIPTESALADATKEKKNFLHTDKLLLRLFPVKTFPSPKTKSFLFRVWSADKSLFLNVDSLWKTMTWKWNRIFDRFGPKREKESVLRKKEEKKKQEMITCIMDEFEVCRSECMCTTTRHALSSSAGGECHAPFTRASRCCVEAKIMATISRASSISPQTSDENVSIFPAHKRKKSFFGLCRPHFRPFRLLARMRGTFYPYILVRVSGNWPCWRCFFLFSVCLFRLFRTIFVNPLSFSRPMPK